MDACYGYREEPFKYGSSLYFEYVGMSRVLSAILLSSWIFAIKLSSDEKLACSFSKPKFSEKGNARRWWQRMQKEHQLAWYNKEYKKDTVRVDYTSGRI